MRARPRIVVTEPMLVVEVIHRLLQTIAERSNLYSPRSLLIIPWERSFVIFSVRQRPLRCQLSPTCVIKVQAI
jgi:hypothetical protein